MRRRKFLFCKSTPAKANERKYVFYFPRKEQKTASASNESENRPDELAFLIIFARSRKTTNNCYFREEWNCLNISLRFEADMLELWALKLFSKLLMTISYS